MSAALQLPSIWAADAIVQEWPIVQIIEAESTFDIQPSEADQNLDDAPDISLAFYRKHTEKMLKRYLYASMLVGRAPAILGEPVGRGFVSCRRVKTFEDAVIFVLDIERCLEKLCYFDRTLLGRIALQEYTREETAVLLGVSTRTIAYKYPEALDRLTELLLDSGLLILPPS